MRRTDHGAPENTNTAPPPDSTSSTSVLYFRRAITSFTRNRVSVMSSVWMAPSSCAACTCPACQAVHAHQVSVPGNVMHVQCPAKCCMQLQVSYDTLPYPVHRRRVQGPRTAW